jgi:hypothetical protein
MFSRASVMTASAVPSCTTKGEKMSASGRSSRMRMVGLMSAMPTS